MTNRKPELQVIKKRLQEAKQRFMQAKKQQRTRKQHRRLRRQVRRQVRQSRGHWYTRGRLLPLLQHLLPTLLLPAFLLLAALPASAQPESSDHALPESTDYALSSSTASRLTEGGFQMRSLYAAIDAFAFFHDNEYDSRIQKGYSLPGARLTPRLVYRPLAQIQIEAGASLLFFDGANKYPCYAYHDIGTWKGNQYQRGAHALPWLRLQASFRHTDVVLGNLYGGSQHDLAAPLFNTEQDMSADPEAGVQVLVQRPHFQSDTWLNWQSYIFELDSHQEAFTVGESMRLSFQSGHSPVEWFIPLQLTIQHRGGEQDTTALGVQTLCNARLGAGLTYRPLSPTLVQHITAQLAAAASYQQAGHIWPFDTGIALHASADARLFRDVTLSADYLYAPRHFASLFGNPFFSTFSLRDPAQSYRRQHVVRIAAGYQYNFASGYTLGTRAELFCLQPHSEQNFSFGVYFRCSPTFLLKR